MLVGWQRERVERWMDILHARVCDGRYWREIGEEFGISTQRARQVARWIPREVSDAMSFFRLEPRLPRGGVPEYDLGRGCWDPGNDAEIERFRGWRYRRKVMNYP